jgi:hypothetical protein
MKIMKTVRLESVTPFDRVNEHTPQPIVESFFAITLSGEDGTLYVNYTRQDTEFGRYAYDAVVGSLLTVDFILGEFRNDEFGPHYKVTRVRVGGYATQPRKTSRKSKLFQQLGI